MDLKKISLWLADNGQPKFRLKQITDAVYKHGSTTFDEISALPEPLRNAIKEGLVPSAKINLKWVIDAYRAFPDKSKFFLPYFDVLAGGPVLREQIEKGMTAEQIRKTWKPGLAKFSKIREKYLLYK